jgi:hypothetical protein
MNEFAIVTACSHTAAVPAIIGMMRYRRILKAYHPFVIVLLLGWLNELISTLLIVAKQGNSVNSNIYVLAEFLGILLLFRNWGTNPKRFLFYKLAGIAITFIWVLDNLILHRLSETNAGYRLCYSLLLAFLSVDQINHVVIIERTPIVRNPKFMICCGVLLYFTFRGLTESLMLFHLDLSTGFYSKYFLVLVVVNVIANLLYSIAVVWMPTRQGFCLRF